MSTATKRRIWSEMSTAQPRASPVSCHVEQQRENDDGNQRQHRIKQDSSRPRRAPPLPVPQLGALGHPDLLLMLEVPGKLARARVALRGVEFHGQIDDFL